MPYDYFDIEPAGEDVEDGAAKAQTRRKTRKSISGHCR